MPTKRRWSVRNIPKRTVYRRDILDVTVDSHAGCYYDYLKDFHSDVGETLTETTTPPEYKPYSEWIEYTNSQFRCYNPCKHIIKRISGSEGGQVFLRKTLNWNSEEECCYHGDEWDNYHYHQQVMLDLRPRVSDWQGLFDYEGVTQNFAYLEGPDFLSKVTTLDRIALDTMIPDLDAGIDLPVFIGELMELRLLWKQFLSVTTYKNILSQISDFKNAPLKELSGSWLALIFGWVPFIRDVKRICEGLWKMFPEIEKYLKHANKLSTLHFVKNLSPYTFKPQSWFDQSPFASITLDTATHYDDWYFARSKFKEIELSIYHTREVEPPEYHGTLLYQYRIPALEQAGNIWLAWLGAILKYWRIKAWSPAQAWELLPFSFVIDWFMSVGPWLEQFDKDWLDVQICCYDFCRSIKYRQEDKAKLQGLVRIIEPYQKADSSALWTMLPQSTTQVQTLECYWRTVGMPKPPEDKVINGRTPRGLQWVTASALLVQLGSRRRRR